MSRVCLIIMLAFVLSGKLSATNSALMERVDDDDDDDDAFSIKRF